VSNQCAGESTPDAGSRRAAALIVSNNPAGPISRLPRSCTSIPSASGRVSRRMNDRAIVRIAVGGELP
jgi:hypothetical protein